MESRPSEQPLESRGEDQTASPRPPERQRRFRIIKLEERIAPSAGGYHLPHTEGANPCNPCQTSRF
jgi:hypothetical protein